MSRGNHDEAMSQLIAMGFDANQARESLNAHNGNLEFAVNHLLMGAGGGYSNHDPPVSYVQFHSSSSGDNASTVVGPISQYSIDNGRSACTCIALTAASMFFTTLDVTPDLLHNMILQGIQTYEQISNHDATVEHLSAEEVLQSHSSLFPLKSLGVRQGMLTNDDQSNHPLSLLVLLQSIEKERPDHDSWLVVLMTKTPETVLLCLPPKNSHGTFWLLDSHPRPQFRLDSAYAKPHSSLEELVSSLKQIFVATDLGPDISEMMAMMYNSFDLYPLKLET